MWNPVSWTSICVCFAYLFLSWVDHHEGAERERSVAESPGQLWRRRSQIRPQTADGRKMMMKKMRGQKGRSHRPVSFCGAQRPRPVGNKTEKLKKWHFKDKSYIFDACNKHCHCRGIKPLHSYCVQI